jgi:hypothetical protein
MRLSNLLSALKEMEAAGVDMDATEAMVCDDPHLAEYSEVSNLNFILKSELTRDNRDLVNVLLIQ